MILPGSAAAVAVGAVAAVIVVLAAAVAGAAALFVRGFATSERHAMYAAPRRGIAELYDRLSTGDLIFFASATNLCYAGTLFSHAAVVVRGRDLVGAPGAPAAPPGATPAEAADLAYAAESTAGAPVAPRGAGPHLALAATRRAAQGAGLTPLLPRLRWYTGTVYVARLEPPLGPAAAASLARAAAGAVGRVPYPGEGAALAALAREALGLPDPPGAPLHCFAHVARLLAAAGLRPADPRARRPARRGFSAVCRAVCDLPGSELAGRRAYGAPERVDYDVDGGRV